MIKFCFDKYEFYGLKIKKYGEYPWTNNIERKEFYSNLYKKKTNRKRIFKFLEKETAEIIHINLSKSFILSVISIILLIIMGVVFIST